MRRFVLLSGLSLLVALLATGAGGAYWLGKRAEPSYEGSIALRGLSGPVRVRFGPHAVPSIEAESLEDAVFAQGYVVASERIWQMDLMRRLASGRLAEIFGPDALPVDRFFRTIGLAVEAQRSLDALDPLSRSLLQRYADGVNAYLGKARGRLPLEYHIAGLSPESWSPLDSLSIGAYMTWTQSFNARGELTFLRLAKRIGPELARELFPTDQAIPAPEVEPELARYLEQRSFAQVAGAGLDALDRALRLPIRFALPIPGPASNAWAVSSGRSRTGGPLLANDPHLAASMPGVWYELELASPDFHVAGVALPGVPLILIGHNEDLAWGITSVLADTQDIFIEQVTSDDAAVRRQGAGLEPIQTRWEEIRVKDGAPSRLAVRSTSRGVVLNDILGRVTDTLMDLPRPRMSDLVVLRQNRDLPDLAFQGLHELCVARTLDEGRTAALRFRHVVSNIVLAHRDGGIAWQVTGLLPKRGRGTGAFPALGWLEDYAWRGFMPQEMNPSVTRPAAGLLINANNRSVAPDYPERISSAWSSPHRAERIAERLDALETMTAEDMEHIQADRTSLEGRMMLSSLRQLEAQIRAIDPDAWESAAGYFGDWDAEMDASSPAAAFAAALEPALFQAIYGDELEDDLPELMSMSLISYSPLQEVLRTGESSFWDDVRTLEPEGPAEIWAKALRSASAALAREAEERDLSGPVRLGALRSITFPHAFRALPILGDLFGVGPIALGGSSDTIDVAKALPQRPWETLFAPSMRYVATPADWGQTRGSLPLGQSGHLFSAYRDDQLEDWLGVRGHRWPWNGPADGRAIGELRLSPDA